MDRLCCGPSRFATDHAVQPVQPLLRLGAAPMANRQSKKGRSNSASRFIMLPWFLMDSDAWLSLTPAERAVYLELARRYNGRNNGFIALSVRDAAERCRINKNTAAKSFRRLQETGFVEVVTPGGFSRKDPHATEWRLTDYRCDLTNSPGSKAFMRWRPAETEKSKSRS